MNTDLSVVIATLGGPTLNKTIDKINQSTVVPFEILICIPELESKNIKVDYPNVKIIPTPVRGQVSQRVYGFKIAKGKYVMQLDDDIYLDKNCIELLIDTVKTTDERIAAAPVMLNVKNNQSIYKRKQYNPFIEKIYHYMLNGIKGYVPGSIDKSGTAHGIDPDEHQNQLITTEWLAGGCVMHKKENLVLTDYFPFSGKAFGEDVIHSYHLKQKGVRLVVNTKARCYLEKVPSTDFTLKQWCKNLYGDYKVRKYLFKLNKTYSPRIYLFYFFSIITYLMKIIIPGGR